MGPIWLVPLLELSGIPIALAMRRAAGPDSRGLRLVVHGYLTLLVVASVMNAVLLLVSMLQGDDTDGVYLLLAGFGVLIINVISFGLVYWWTDAGGPLRRLSDNPGPPDFLFPQQASPTTWRPGLIDYLFTAYTNIIAFSPTDTMPLTAPRQDPLRGAVVGRAADDRHHPQPCHQPHPRRDARELGEQSDRRLGYLQRALDG